MTFEADGVSSIINIEPLSEFKKLRSFKLSCIATHDIETWYHELEKTQSRFGKPINSNMGESISRSKSNGRKKVKNGIKLTPIMSIYLPHCPFYREPLVQYPESCTSVLF